jgi:hypothetical protein
MQATLTVQMHRTRSSVIHPIAVQLHRAFVHESVLGFNRVFEADFPVVPDAFAPMKTTLAVQIHRTRPPPFVVRNSVGTVLCLFRTVACPVLVALRMRPANLAFEPSFTGCFEGFFDGK